MTIVREQPPILRKRLAEAHPSEIGLSAITYLELIYGAWKSSRYEAAYKTVVALRSVIQILPLDDSAADHYGRIRLALEKKGQIIGSNDLLIAAHALALDATLVTNNEKEFRRVPGLRVENWAKVGE